MLPPAGREEIDEAAIEAFLLALAATGATPRTMVDDALALATLLRDPTGDAVARLPIGRATLAETLRRLRERLIAER